MHALEVYVKEGLVFACELFLENSADSDSQCLTSFFSIDHLLRYYA